MRLPFTAAFFWLMLHLATLSRAAKLGDNYNNKQKSAATAHILQVASNGSFNWSHNITRRNIGDISGELGGFKQLRAGSVTCPELAWPDFQPFQNIGPNTQCWDDVKPLFRLYAGDNNTVISEEAKHLGNLPRNSTFPMSPISLLVVIIHGFASNAELGAWPDLLARDIVASDPRPDLYVLTVDWSEGAAASFPHIYETAAANTRYVGVATERIVSQLRPDTLHCIGHSLGAHTCGFLSNAMEADTEYRGKKVDRITAMDPAGPNFYKTLLLGTPINSPLDEKLDKTDAVLVDAIHTDTDTLGTVASLGHADFYVGYELAELGRD